MLLVGHWGIEFPEDQTQYQQRFRFSFNKSWVSGSVLWLNFSSIQKATVVSQHQ